MDAWTKHARKYNEYNPIQNAISCIIPYRPCHVKTLIIFSFFYIKRVDLFLLLSKHDIHFTIGVSLYRLIVDIWNYFLIDAYLILLLLELEAVTEARWNMLRDLKKISFFSLPRRKKGRKYERLFEKMIGIK